jgi:hypothetical protein
MPTCENPGIAAIKTVISKYNFFIRFVSSKVGSLILKEGRERHRRNEPIRTFCRVRYPLMQGVAGTVWRLAPERSVAVIIQNSNFTADKLKHAKTGIGY